MKSNLKTHNSCCTDPGALPSCGRAAARSSRWCGRLAILGLAAVCLGLLGLSGEAAAQADKTQTREDPRLGTGARVTREVNPNRDIQGQEDPERVSEAFQPKGIGIGQFLLLPKVETAGLYNDNVFASSNNRRGDFLTRITPELDLRSRFSTHQLNFLAQAEQTLYRTYTDDNTLEGLASANGRYDITRDWQLRGGFNAYQRYEDRGSPDDAGGMRPTRMRGVVGRAGTRTQIGRFTVEADFGSERMAFADVRTSTGGLINNADRDRWQYEAVTRGAYEMFPGYAAVVELSANERAYDAGRDDTGVNRDSRGYRALAGIGLDLSDLIRGDFLVGYLSQDYQDPSLRDPTGLAFKAQLNWTPSRLTIVVPALERSVQETTLVRTSAIVRSAFSLIVRHELERNIVLTYYGSVALDDFEGSTQRNYTYESRLRGIWALAPEYFIGAELGYRQRTSNLSGQDFTQIITSVRLGLRI